MPYPYKTISISGLLSAAFLLNGCTQLVENDQAWTGVSAGTVSAAPEFTAPVGGGQFGQRTPPDVMQNTYGYRGEDLSAAAPGAVGADGLYSYDSSKDGALNGDTLNGIQNQNGSDVFFNPRAPGPGPADWGDENYDPADPVEDWLATEGSSVRSLLTQWGDKAGWRVVWNTDREYILEAGAMFRGRFMDVASALIRSFARAQPSPWGTFYKGNRVLLVTTQEDENAD